LLQEKDGRIKELEKELNESSKMASEVQLRLLETKRLMDEKEQAGSTSSEEMKISLYNMAKRLEAEVLAKEAAIKEKSQYRASLKSYKNENKDLKEKNQELSKLAANLSDELTRNNNERKDLETRSELWAARQREDEEGSALLTKKYEQLKIKYRETANQLEQFKTSGDQSNTELNQLKQKNVELQNQVAFLQGKIVQELKRKEEETEEKKNLLSELNNYKKSYEESQKTFNNLKQEQFNTQRLLSQTSEQRKKIDMLESDVRKLPDMEEKLKNYKVQNEKLLQQKSELMSQLEEARTYIDNLQSERVQQNNINQKAIAALEEENKYLSQQLSKKSEEIEHYGELTKELEDELTRRKQEHTDALSKYYSIKDEHEATVSTVNEYHQEVATLKVQLTHLTKVQSQYNALKEEYDILRSNNMDFVHRVAETETELLEMKEQVRTASKQLINKKKEIRKDKLTYNQELKEALERNKELQAKLTSSETSIEEFRDKLKSIAKQLNDTQKLNKQDKDMLKDQLEKNSQLNEETKKL